MSGLGTFYIASTLLNAGTNLLNGHFTRKQQERFTEENRAMTLRLEQDRQNFQLDIFEKNADLQRSISEDRHVFALKEIRANFEVTCKSTEWKLFLDRWPLVALPSVVRDAQILPDGTVALRIVFSHSSDMQFNTYVYPYVEQRLREFVDLYPNVFGSKNIIFYHRGFSSAMHGGALEENIHYALKEIPVMIIDTNILQGEIAVSVTVWGFGSSEKKHCTIFNLPYEKKTSDNKPDQDYYRELSDKLLAHLKFVIGYTYDTYNLIEYNVPPLLGKVARYEVENKSKNCMLNYPEVTEYFAKEYLNLFKLVFSSDAFKNTKSYLLPGLQLSFAEATKEYMPADQFCDILNASLSSWAFQRTTDEADKFLQALKTDKVSAKRYISETDIAYLTKLVQLYRATHTDAAHKSAETIAYIVEKAKTATALPDISKPDNAPKPKRRMMEF